MIQTAVSQESSLHIYIYPYSPITTWDTQISGVQFYISLVQEPPGIPAWIRLLTKTDNLPLNAKSTRKTTDDPTDEDTLREHAKQKQKKKRDRQASELTLMTTSVPTIRKKTKEKETFMYRP
jgi:hypothetical protein